MAIGKIFGWLFMISMVLYVVYAVNNGPGGYGKAIESPILANGRTAQYITTPDCMDLDGGKDFNVRGSTYNIHNDLIYDDYCENTETLVEYYCDGSRPNKLMKSCDCFLGYCRNAR